nr:9472_t:CDS:2 [Entrophospora candida]
MLLHLMIYQQDDLINAAKKYSWINGPRKAFQKKLKKILSNGLELLKRIIDVFLYLDLALSTIELAYNNSRLRKPT